MIDLHSHILPGIDDGAQSMEDALLMANKAVEEGITAICATPHHRNGRYENEKELIEEELLAFSKELVLNDIPLQVLPGQEVRMYRELIDDIDRGKILTLNHNNHLLIEFPSGSVPDYATNMIYELRLLGITPIIVHPERNSEILENPDLLYDFILEGALTQITANSITGNFGKRIMNFSYDLLKANMVHVIASDAHNLSSRGFNLREAYRNVEKDFGAKKMYYLQENAELIVNGESVFIEQPLHIRKKKFLGMF